MQRLIAADIPQRLRAPAADASEVKWRGSVSQSETQPGVRRYASTLIISLLLLNFHNKLLPMAALMMVAEMLMVTSVVVWI